MLPLIASFAGDFYLVGGTALALQFGHRRSIDFDLFKRSSFNNYDIRSQVKESFPIEHIFIESKNEFTLIINQVKLTFYHYPYEISHLVIFEGGITMPDPLTIAAMKAFALGRRAKWKDYVDLYFIFQKYSLAEVVKKTENLFGKGEFNERLFRGQLAYYQDIDYKEKVEYMPGFEVSDDEIKKVLQEVSLQQ